MFLSTIFKKIFWSQFMTRQNEQWVNKFRPYHVTHIDQQNNIKTWSYDQSVLTDQSQWVYHLFCVRADLIDNCFFGGYNLIEKN